MYHTPPSTHIFLADFIHPTEKKDRGTSSDCYIFEAPHGVLSVKHGTTRTTRWSRARHFRVTMGYPPNATFPPMK